MVVKGSCLCRRVCYEIDGLDMPIGHCSCHTCRKAHASVFTTTAGVLTNHFRIVSGEDALRSYESSPGKRRHFCQYCGTHVFAQRSSQEHIILRVATLDDDPGARPQVHIFSAHEPAWLNYQNVATFAEWSED